MARRSLLAVVVGLGARSFQLSIPGTPTGGPFGKNALVYHDDLVTTELGQIGTQFDGPGHIGVRTSKGDFYYTPLLRDKVYEFAFVWAPLKVVGATGSPGNPIALY